MKSSGTDVVSLIGMMGSGKTTVGKALAEDMGWDFIDVDQTVEQTAALSIDQIFDKEGETRFRDLEQECLKDALNQRGPRAGSGLGGSKLIVACGGGVILRETNRALLRERSVVVLLEVDAKIAAERLLGSANRPLLAPKGGDDSLEAVLARLLTERDHLYRMTAHHVVDAETPPQDVAAQIKRLIGAAIAR